MLDMWYTAGFPDGTKKVFVFNTKNNLISTSNIRDYSWEYNERFKKVQQFNKKLTTREIPITFFQRRSGNKNELYKEAEAMYAMFDRDVRALKMGKLWIGKYDPKIEPDDLSHIQGYYIDCYIMESSKTAYDNNVAIKSKLKVLSDFRWHRVMEKSFGTQSGGGSSQDYDFLDFNYDFLYDYAGSVGTEDIRNFATSSIAPFDFRITFEGAVEDPEIQVGDWIYRVYTSIGEGEQLIIDSLEKRVYRRLPNGSEVSEFNNRDRDWYIFQPMPLEEGQSRVVWQEGHQVSIRAYIERSEPTWLINDTP